MFSLLLFRFSKPNSCLVLLFFLTSFNQLPWALSKPEVRLCDTLFQCGNLTAGFPFWGGARLQPCGHPSLGLRCDDDTTNFTFLVISDLMYQVLQVNTTTGTLKLARQDFLGPFCELTFSSESLTPELFELLPEYKTLFAHYLCNPPTHYPLNFSCPHMGVGLMHQKDDYYNDCGGSLNITVPMSYVPEEKHLNVSKLESVLKEGFEVKLRIHEKCQDCKSTGGFCSYDDSTPVCCKTNLSSDTKCIPMIPSGSTGLLKRAKIGIGFASGFLGASLFIGCMFCFIIRKRNKLAAQYTRKGFSNTMSNTETMDVSLHGIVEIKQYSYEEVKKITKSFSNTVGKGGFGTVYGGNLYDGRKVAVKILKDFKGSKRAIVYEFLENGSLDKFISCKESLNLDVGTLYRIALGVAKGLEYLHHGCKTRIVHFDIKPQNVLLDENLCPKVSDFGLAKLCERRESMMSLLDARGTIGYIAPEVFSGMYGRVSHKSDVYSYGMLVLEMIGAKNKVPKETDASNPSSAYFPDWIYKDLENEDHTWKFGEDISREEKEIAKKMTLVGLWCIQPCPLNRPPMNQVVGMMEGSVDALEVPPKPSLHLFPQPLPESSSLSENNSKYSEVLTMPENSYVSKCISSI
ncbi:LEAF RUST 10 DISEASE-RESISTANCE LOCUS RECEPTOR-LIKE PROTEIN KINASE-like 2.3 isoform X2 [Capsella rubella]|uniref:LEAF RUST 10 DISEASE-RESISTANCE LOCUS RECEPTOR-LIKE PROTEIN KINASE-like 2.3 isoform X2 n=1 Tax=Capsella rubella TaxID=81985 RepID=UPI000CD5499D|nr:LEAF RUST 10 DISEASE-RESISTANCE LOCUS RECEPTOR-LIKE PROTEIN KINASE-like 2.3 isoform X2 [Capsella rubella]